jgi:hypothetical protein
MPKECLVMANTIPYNTNNYSLIAFDQHNKNMGQFWIIPDSRSSSIWNVNVIG